MKYIINVKGVSFFSWNPDDLIGKENNIFLLAEPNNKYDSNAIAVCLDDGTQEGIALGYIPKEETDKVKPLIAKDWKIYEAGRFQDNLKYLKIITDIEDLEHTAFPMKTKEEEDKWVDVGDGWQMNKKTRERIKDGEKYFNISSVLNLFNLEGREDGWEDVKISSFKTGEEYRRWLDGKARLGSALHKCIEMGTGVTSDILKEFRIEEQENTSTNFVDWKPTKKELQNMYLGFDRWKTDYGITEIKKEKVVKWNKIASPCDMLARDGNGRMMAVDFKISKKIKERYKVQSWFYSKAFREEIGIEMVKPVVLLLGVENLKGFSHYDVQSVMPEEHALKILDLGVSHLEYAKTKKKKARELKHRSSIFENSVVWPELKNILFPDN